VEKEYWLSRQRASLELARSAAGSQARLVHYDLAGRYSVKASSTESQTVDVADAKRSYIDPARAMPGVKHVNKT